ncbi:MAG: hypothetical protein CSB48_11255 [Proteobacteria bacterium]|nr:MAG: hypothetical protein CSB48_11255 [Pseudomonadota bacterium]
MIGISYFALKSVVIFRNVAVEVLPPGKGISVKDEYLESSREKSPESVCDFTAINCLWVINRLWAINYL